MRGGGGDSIHFTGPIDGTDRIVIAQDRATWEHISRGYPSDSVFINTVQWRPDETDTLWNSGATTFLTNVVNFLAAELEVVRGRDTVVLEPRSNAVIITLAHTPNGEEEYEFHVRFPPIPELRVRAEIDGSDALHVSRYGARWFHKEWGWPTNVTLNGMLWAPKTNNYLANEGPTAFMPSDVDFCRAVVVTNVGRDLCVVATSEDGLIIHFADNPNGRSPYEVLVQFPPGATNVLSRPAISSTNAIAFTEAAAITFDTTAGQLYELQFTHDLVSSNWVSAGAFLRGDGNVMSFYDPAGLSTSKIYRVVSTDRMR